MIESIFLFLKSSLFSFAADYQQVFAFRLYTKKLYEALTGIQMGRLEAPEGWLQVIE